MGFLSPGSKTVLKVCVKVFKPALVRSDNNCAHAIRILAVPKSVVVSKADTAEITAEMFWSIIRARESAKSNQVEKKTLTRSLITNEKVRISRTEIVIPCFWGSVKKELKETTS